MNSKFVVYKEDKDLMGLLYKDQKFSDKVYVDVGDTVIEYDGIADYLEDGWNYTAYFNEDNQESDEKGQ